MFTGLVQAKGRVRAIQRQPMGVRLVVDRQGWTPAGITLGHGDSVCVSGVCLTLTAMDATSLSFDVIAQTLSTTKLGQLQAGADVNLEPPLTPTSQLGGHFVQGHVDGVGQVKKITANSSEHRITITPPTDLLDYLAPKGSIAIDGVSLTLARVGQNDFDVALIPTTLGLTTLANLHEGDPVNLETDMIAKTIVHWLRRQKEQGGSVAAGGLTLEGLHRAGF